MEGELFNTIQNQENGATAEPSREVKPLSGFSFIPPELLKKSLPTAPLSLDGRGSLTHTATMVDRGLREKCAVAGFAFGVFSLVSWIVILFGIVTAIVGAIFSVVGFESNNSKYARIGLGLSIVGIVAAILYVLAAYQGIINYNYFTTEFWM